jgi:glycosyltransferase involved in cell wall biosynthesis
MPTVSIITPLHNKGPFVAETLASVQAQTMLKWEMIVVENHSSDDGPEQVERLAAVDQRIRLVRAPETVRGPGDARNLGLSLARGDWVLFLDADDLIASNHLESLLEVGRATGAPAVASDWLEFVNGSWEWGGQGILNDSATHVLPRHHAAGSLVPVPRISVQDSSIAYAPWAVHCGLVRRDALEPPRRWVETLDRYPSEDTVFWFRVLMGRKTAYTRLATAIYRTETPNYRNTHGDLERWAEAMVAIHAENVRYLQVDGHSVNSDQAECLMRVWSKIGADCREQGLCDLSSEAYRRAEQWIRLAGWNSPALFIRKLLGCQIVDQMRTAL